MGIVATSDDHMTALLTPPLPGYVAFGKGSSTVKAGRVA